MTDTELEAFRVVNIGPSSVSQAQSILYNAYKDNELMHHLLDAHKPDYNQRLRSLIREDILAHFTSSNISVALASGSRLIGAAIVERAAEPLDFFSNWRWKLGMYSTVGYFRTERLHKYYEAVHELLEQIDHYWITFIGIHPDYQHQGYGPKLVDAIHEACERDPDYHGISIDLTGTDLETFFEHRGYNKVGEVPAGGIMSEIYFHPKEGEECRFTSGNKSEPGS